MTLSLLLDPVADPMAAPVANIISPWQVVVGPNSVGPQYELTQAKSRVLSMHTDDSAVFSFTLDGSDPALQYIQELVTDVWVYRNGLLLYRGRIGSTTDTLDGQADTYSVDVNTFDYREWLARQILQPSHTWSWRGVTQAKILQDLFAYCVNQPGIKPTFTLDLSKMPTSTVNFDITVGTSVKETIGTMAGFGWQVFPDSQMGITLRAMSPWYYGLNSHFVMEYGGTVDQVTRSYDTSGYANTVVYTGDMNLAPVQADASGIATMPQGRIGEVASNPAITDKAHLQQAATNEATRAQNVVPSWQCHLASGIWQDSRNAWIGDICRFVVSKNRLVVNDQYRITDMDISIDDDSEMGDDVTLTIAKPPYVPSS